MKKAIIIGATSGIGRGLAKILVENDYLVGITGRRTNLLEEIKAEKPDSYFIENFDISNAETVSLHLEKLVSMLGGLDLLILSSGTDNFNEALDYELEKRTISTNVNGFTAIADWSFNFFRSQQHGHLAAISSIAGLRGNRQSPAYAATKAYQIIYLESLRVKAKNLGHPVYITDIRPGFVDTEMAKSDILFWVAPVQKAATQIYKAIEAKRKVVYITKRWKMIGILVKMLPKWIIEKF
jgi:short-subunit dehydrogenase